MENKDKLKEICIKNRACYHFDDIISGIDINFSDILLDKNMKTFQFMTFHTKFRLVQSHSLLGSIK